MPVRGIMNKLNKKEGCLGASLFLSIIISLYPLLRNLTFIPMVNHHIR